ncbi:MAG: hypothetical protein OXC26_17500, partial [Albidovulum sp.]|nr:hypothetical protein [Albidovulum sp.]
PRRAVAARPLRTRSTDPDPALRRNFMPGQPPGHQPCVPGTVGPSRPSRPAAVRPTIRLPGIAEVGTEIAVI